MKKYSIIALLMLIGGELHARRLRGSAVRPSTTAEQLMTKYIPKPYPPQHGQHRKDFRRFDRARPFAYAPYYGTDITGYEEDYPLQTATNEPEHLGID